MSGSWLGAEIRSGLGVQVLGEITGLSESDLKALRVDSEAHLNYFPLARSAVLSLNSSRSRWIGD